jgi:hypothetical protein
VKDAVFAKPWPPVRLETDEVPAALTPDENAGYDEDDEFAFMVAVFGARRGRGWSPDDDDEWDD